MDACKLQYLLHVDGATSFDPGRNGVLLIVALTADDYIVDRGRVVIAIDCTSSNQCQAFTAASADILGKCGFEFVQKW